MKWIESFSLVMRSSIATLREKIEDPERMLHQLLIDMEEELVRVREDVAATIADEIQLARRREEARDQARQWTERAQAALARGDEESARAALAEKLVAEGRAADLEKEHAKQAAETARLQEAVRDLEEKIRQARRKQALLLARLARAKSSDLIARTLERTEGPSAFAQFRRLEERVERAEAMEEARDRMAGRDPAAEKLKREFEEKERKERLETELRELKRRAEGGR